MSEVNLSVIVPVYNVEKYIEKCIRSLKKQDCECIEFIIVDDGSKDKSISLCEESVADDERFRIIHKSNGGLMSAWKAGVKEATGEYIGFVDSDDWIDPDMFSILLEKIKETNADIVCSGYIAENGNALIKVGREKEFIFSGNQIRDEFIKEYCCSYFLETCYPTICRWDKIYRKTLIMNNMQYFNEKVSMGEDFNANLPMLLDANKIVLMKDFYPYHYRNNPTSIVNTVNPKAFNNIIELEKICQIIVKDKNMDSFYVDSFIGNMIFEEINKICKTRDFDSCIIQKLNDNLAKCNANYYLDKYVKVRDKIRLRMYYWVIKNRWIGVIRLMNIMYRIRG